MQQTMYFFELSQYFPIFIFLLIAMGLGMVIVALPFVLAKRIYYKNKNTEYECGFDRFEQKNHQFDVRFYLISILFVIFDLEIAFLFPWAITVKKLGWVSFWSMMFFVLILTIGFIYEWAKGALEWE